MAFSPFSIMEYETRSEIVIFAATEILWWWELKIKFLIKSEKQEAGRYVHIYMSSRFLIFLFIFFFGSGVETCVWGILLAKVWGPTVTQHVRCNV